MKISIVGGGPVGLITSIVLIEDNKNYKIDIYEKRKKNTRKQYIVSGGTKGDLSKNLPKKLRLKIRESILCFIDNPVVNKYGYCYKNKPGIDFYDFSFTIEIQKLQKILLEYIKKEYKSNIKYINKEFTKKDVGDYDIIIGADGHKSFVRNELMKVKWTPLKKYESYILHVKYIDRSNKKYLVDNIIPEKYKNSLSIKLKRKHPFTIGEKKQEYDQDRFRLIRSNTNKTQLLLQIDKTTYNKIKNIKVFGKLPKKIQDIVLVDSFMMNSLPTNLKNTPINVYNQNIGSSDKYAIIKNKKLFLLFGDSAMTTHIFTGEGLNINFKILKETIESYVLNFPSQNKSQIIKSYNARLNYSFVNIIKYSIYLRYMPHKVISKICSNIEMKDLGKLLINEVHFRYDYFISNIQKKYKNIPIAIIKKELCYIFRDKILKYFIYRFNK